VRQQTANGPGHTRDLDRIPIERSDEDDARIEQDFRWIVDPPADLSRRFAKRSSSALDEISRGSVSTGESI
jgi:hypothetical protein